MKIKEFQGKKITVMGLGLSGGGVGIIKFLTKANASVTVTDLRTKTELEPSLKELKSFKVKKYILGQHRPEDFINADLIIKNPAVPSNSRYLEIAQKHHIPIDTDMGIFFEACPGPILGVTGTRGKTTTATLLHSIIQKKYKDAFLAGNLRISPFDHLAKLKSSTPVILELSSWQLEDLAPRKKSPHLACITNLYPDHLNRYPNLESYINSKKNIFRFQNSQDFLILNHDNLVTRSFAEETKSQIFYFSKNKNGSPNSVFVEGKQIIFKNSELINIPLLSLEDIQLPGEHNLYNVLAACACACAFEIEPKYLQKAIKSFSGIPYRLEFRKEVRGVKIYNDTTSTAPEATQAALNSFQDPIVLLCGGNDKKLDFKKLSQDLLSKTKKTFFLAGDATEKIISELKKSPQLPSDWNLTPFTNLEEAVQAAFQATSPGDILLFSPGATSFRMFKNEFDRGDQFNAIIEKIK
jgi:UDP-N-acetylmuramoylalanine--D-glutamate ligase